jgi:hypothetical protein
MAIMFGKGIGLSGIVLATIISPDIVLLLFQIKNI